MSAPARLGRQAATPGTASAWVDRKSTRLNSSHSQISYAVFCLKKKKKNRHSPHWSRQTYRCRDSETRTSPDAPHVPTPGRVPPPRRNTDRYGEPCLLRTRLTPH